MQGTMGKKIIRKLSVFTRSRLPDTLIYSCQKMTLGVHTGAEPETSGDPQ